MIGEGSCLLMPVACLLVTRLAGSGIRARDDGSSEESLMSIVGEHGGDYVGAVIWWSGRNTRSHVDKSHVGDRC
jgi:hypothetical protein